VDYQQITFGKTQSESQLYFHANKHFKGFSLSGRLRFTVEGDGSQPTVAPDGTILTHTWAIGAGYVLHGYSPNGTPKWSFYVSPNNINSAADVDLKGNAYVGWNLASLYRLSPAGTQKWKFTEPDMGILNDPIVNPAGSLVLMGGQPNYGQPGYFEAVRARRGKLAWKQDLGLDPGSGQPIVPFSRSRFSSDGITAFASAIVLGVYDYSFLYGLATS
jgi:hypothetical protein